MRLIDQLDDRGLAMFRPVTGAWIKVTGRDSYSFARTALAVSTAAHIVVLALTFDPGPDIVGVIATPILFVALLIYINQCERDSNSASGLRGALRLRLEPFAKLMRLLGLTFGAFTVPVTILNPTTLNICTVIDHVLQAAALYAALHNEPGTGQTVFAKLRDKIAGTATAAAPTPA